MDGITSPKCDTHVSNLFVLYYAEILTIFFKENKKKCPNFIRTEDHHQIS